MLGSRSWWKHKQTHKTKIENKTILTACAFSSSIVDKQRDPTRLRDKAMSSTKLLYTRTLTIMKEQRNVKYVIDSTVTTIARGWTASPARAWNKNEHKNEIRNTIQ